MLLIFHLVHLMMSTISYATSCHENLGVLTLRADPPMQTENLEIRYGTSQFPPIEQFLISDYIERYHYYQDPLGDRWEVQLLLERKHRAEQEQTLVQNADARRLTQGLRNVILTNFGPNRYFWFRPQGEENYFPARVLDIHIIRNRSVGDSLVFLVEHLAEVGDGGALVHRIHQLSAVEFPTIFSEINGKNRGDAAAAFLDSLNSDEIQVLQLAQQWQLKLYGYVDAHRSPGRYEDGAITPLAYMNSITHLAIKSYCQRTYPFIDGMLNATEKQTRNFNYIDFFAQLHPRLVVAKFGGNRYLGTEFNWVITEDGKLKLMPTLNLSNNLRPRIFRLASGRKIFAGGRLRFRPDGGVDVALNAEGYQQMNAAWGDQGAYQESNLGVNEFVKIVIEMQTSLHVNGLQITPIDRWAHFGKAGIGADDVSSSGEKPTGPDWAELFNGPKKKAEQATAGEQVALSWDRQDQIPLDLMAYAKYFLREPQDHQLQIDWAHYVLETNRSMSLGKVKQRYRRMQMIYHPDRMRPPDPAVVARSTAITTLLNQAYRLLEDKLKLQN